MSRLQYIILGGSVTLVVAIVIIITTILRSNEPTQEADSFCEAFPNALFCQEETPSELDIAEDMMKTLMAHYPNVMTESFCMNYFTGHLVDYCLDNPAIIVPIDFSIVSNSFQIVEYQEGIYDIRTRYSNNVPAYTFRLSLNDMDGAYHISGFSYFDTPATVYYELSNEDIDTFLDVVMESYNDDDSRYCERFFTWIAGSLCRQDQDSFEWNLELDILHTAEKLSSNRYLVTYTDDVESAYVQYEIVLEDVDGTMTISELEVSIPEMDLSE